ncbi:hypothetical protein VTN49DRAFT_860 [Thermomyces lanuginosus]|uniref:uncharacterized protein n=1 Tax=Thermomyces lanuginosus TaxID=5541 RepID=UPI0037423EC1
MPARKKAKISARQSAATTPVEPPKQATALGAGDAAPKSDSEHDVVNDPWTDEQETALLKGIVRWKPVGMHKHFRMIAISEYMKSQGYAPANEEHTRIPGIWKKLNSLYNLPALDEREDSIIYDESDESEYCPFELPQGEFGEMMFARRLADEPSDWSDVSEHAGSRRGSTVADTDAEQRSSPAPSRRRTKSTRTTRGTRSARLQVEADAGKKATPTPSAADDEDVKMEDADDADEEGGSDEAENEDEAAGETQSTRTTRTQTSKSRQQKESGSRGTRRTGRRR